MLSPVCFAYGALLPLRHVRLSRDEYGCLRLTACPTFRNSKEHYGYLYVHDMFGREDTQFLDEVVQSSKEPFRYNL